jgi:dihydroflavonol-4-reductase
MTRILVTGGSGFIGQHLVSELVARGRQVRILDLRPPTQIFSGAEYIEGSVLDKGLVHNAVAGVDEVYHLAGLPGMWQLDRADFHAINFVGTRNVLTAARRYGAARFLHCSTESILFHASPPGDLTAEEAPLSVDAMPGPYTRSKMLADELALQSAALGLPVIVGCPTMPIGTHDHSITPPAAMLEHFVGGGSLQIFLDFIVNLVDVRDVAKGLILAMEKGRVGHRYVLGGKSLPLKQILALMASISGRRRFFVPLPGPLAELAASIMEFNADYLTHRPPAATVEGVRIARRASALSSEKARRELGYLPGPVEPLLQQLIIHMAGASPGRVLKHA